VSPVIFYLTRFIMH